MPLIRKSDARWAFRHPNCGRLGRPEEACGTVSCNEVALARLQAEYDALKKLDGIVL